MACTIAGFQDRCLKPLGHPSLSDLNGLLRSHKVQTRTFVPLPPACDPEGSKRVAMRTRNVPLVQEGGDSGVPFRPRQAQSRTRAAAERRRIHASARQTGGLIGGLSRPLVLSHLVACNEDADNPLGGDGGTNGHFG
jgi:hypothetical protein